MVTLYRNLVVQASLLELPRGWYEADEMVGKVQNGFTFLGQGMARSTWKGPDGQAYKIPRSPGTCYQSDREVERSVELRSQKLPDWLVIPEIIMEPETRILVAECIEGVYPTEDQYWNCNDGRYGTAPNCGCNLDPCLRKRVLEVEDLTKLGDLHQTNVMLLPLDTPLHYKLAILDMGC